MVGNILNTGTMGMNTNRKVERMLGRNTTNSVCRMRQSNSSFRGSGHVGTGDVVMKIRRLLDKLPEVEKAKGTLTIKLKNRAPRTLQFNYQ